uniref:Uncharacterized protein n=1 Tax=Setaria viridis TaxID=4556 RepID=A0A4U6V0L6_SETVI|nr:hypothetical protein SEVIR_4G147001v2 [Setaria viridis]
MLCSKSTTLGAQGGAPPPHSPTRVFATSFSQRALTVSVCCGILSSQS